MPASPEHARIQGMAEPGAAAPTKPGQPGSPPAGTCCLDLSTITHRLPRCVQPSPSLIAHIQTLGSTMSQGDPHSMLANYLKTTILYDALLPASALLWG